jgi:hypothetical protein
MLIFGGFSMNPFVFAAGVCFIFLVCLAPAFGADDLQSVRKEFAAPDRAYASAPLWVWNDMMTDEEIANTLQALAAQDVRQAFVHPRPGLMTPYLSEEWFRLWKVALVEAEKLGMNIWIYDENSYPSGFAGGHVPDTMPESRGKGLTVRETRKIDNLPESMLAAYRLEEGVYRNITDEAKAGHAAPDRDYLLIGIKQTGPSPWFGGKWYVDLLHPGVTEQFLKLTLEPYRQHLGEEFGKRLPGSFTDEPHLAPAGGLHWTDDLPAVFEKRWGYSLIDNLPYLFKPVGDWKKVRHDYYQTLLELFIERWAKPYFEYCTKNGLEFTGHYWEHEWPNCGSAPDNMAMGAWQQRPGIDILFNQYDEGPHAQFGNVRAVLELASVANQMGWERTLCETYGGSGWDARFEDFKRIGDWVYVLGVNTLNEHLSHSTLRGARKGDYPPVFSYHTTWWEGYHVIEDYFTRLSFALSRGDQVNNILVLEPTTTAWMYQGEGGGETLGKLGDTFQKFVTDLAKAQVEFDLGCEDIIARGGAVDGAAFVVGKRRYSTVVIPANMENVNGKTAELLESYVKAGGAVVCCGAAPSRIDGKASDQIAEVASGATWKQLDPAEALKALRVPATGFLVRRAENDEGILYHHRRQLPEGDLLFLVNTSIEKRTAGTVETPLAGVEEWNLDTGTFAAYVFESKDGATSAKFDLEPCGSLLLFLSKDARKPANPAAEKRTPVEPAAPVQAKPAELNVLTLDFVDVTAGGETKKNCYTHTAAQFAFKQHGMGVDPWDHAVQFRDELIAKVFPPDSGFDVTYRFAIEGKVPAQIFAVIERADIYTVACNGKPVKVTPGEWWLDRAFPKIDITGSAVVGENVITLKAQPFTMFHEIAPVYILGNFALKQLDKGFSIVPGQELKLGPWRDQGYPLYGAGVTYSASYKASGGKHVVKLTDWYGSVARVAVNGKTAGYIYRRPCELDVSGLVKPGANTVEVTVIGTLKNTLGPHHGNPPLGIASPGHFAKGPETGPPPGKDYSTVAYGLFAPFVVERVD